jgi:Cys-rich repeat protein
MNGQRKIALATVFAALVVSSCAQNDAHSSNAAGGPLGGAGAGAGAGGSTLAAGTGGNAVMAGDGGHPGGGAGGATPAGTGGHPSQGSGGHPSGGAGGTSSGAGGASSGAGGSTVGGTGGTATGGAGGATGSGGAGACPAKPLSTPQGRPTPKACSVSQLEMGLSASGPAPCAAKTDCPAGPGERSTCLNGQCSADACINDSDCPSGQACGCAADYYGGNAQHPNLCFPAQCRVDADCPAGGVCEPSYGGPCGGLTGFFCHSASDTCNSSSDCCGNLSACLYQPELGHWACQAVMVCSG